MDKIYLVVATIAIFVFGMFFGVKIIDNNKSIYVQVRFGDAGNFTVGKQLDLTDLSSFHDSDKALLISGIKRLQKNDVLSEGIIELEKLGSGIFTPEEFEVKLHITTEHALKRGIAAICESHINEFHRKTLSIFDNRENSVTKNMIRVGAWDTLDNTHCLDEKSHHVWVSPETAELLLPKEFSVSTNVTSFDLLGRVSNSCKL